MSPVDARQKDLRGIDQQNNQNKSNTQHLETSLENGVFSYSSHVVCVCVCMHGCGYVCVFVYGTDCVVKVQLYLLEGRVCVSRS